MPFITQEVLLLKVYKIIHGLSDLPELTYFYANSYAFRYANLTLTRIIICFYLIRSSETHIILSLLELIPVFKEPDSFWYYC